MISVETIALFELCVRYWYYQFDPVSDVATDSYLRQWPHFLAQNNYIDIANYYGRKPPFFEGRDGEKINCRVCLSVGAYGHVIDDLALLAELFSVDGSFRPLVAKGVLMLLKSANYNYYFVKLFE
ncbi:hypothetical protein [Lactiplantibacillus paraplantarum]|uniref:hypothetical protein n=1 Tax=Lactiplantibacillus paraplantarum TaxID=60520 RepID=UPI0011C05EE5|nr:hypothetical protein [Lactiplantibacillus paraplantarum]